MARSWKTKELEKKLLTSNELLRREYLNQIRELKATQRVTLWEIKRLETRIRALVL